MPKRKKVFKKTKKVVKKKHRANEKNAEQPAKKLKRLPAKVLKIYKTLLVAERAKVGGELSHITEETLNKSQRDLSGDLSGYSYHMADMASDDYERDFSLGRATAEQGILFAIDEALKRIDEGTFGYCQSCSKLISKQRLKALPYTSLCIECQKKTDMK